MNFCIELPSRNDRFSQMLQEDLLKEIFVFFANHVDWFLGFGQQAYFSFPTHLCIAATALHALEVLVIYYYKND